MVEYVLIIALVAVAAVLAFTGLKDGIEDKLESVNDQLESAGN
ncbi:MAG: Flp family type IVb pilin [Lachnospiraceae bacterium]|nr:Flp family type IVb pilin [Lachnospiraceae bacterium]